MMKKLKLKDKKQYLLKIDESRSIEHEQWRVGTYHESLECFNLNPTIGFQTISECIEIDEIKKLQHHRDTTCGLYAFDKDIDSIFEDLPTQDECKTIAEAHLVQQINFLKSIIFQINQ